MRTSHYHVSSNQHRNKLNLSICREKKAIDNDTYSFIMIVANYYSLSSSIVDHIVWLVKHLKNSDYHSLCNNMTYENIVLASTLYAIQCSGLPCYEDNDVSGFVECIYKPENRKQELIQIYSLYQNLIDLFYDSGSSPLSQVDEMSIIKPIWK